MADGNGRLTPWDVQSRQIFSVDGVWMTLYAGQGGGKGYVLITDSKDKQRDPDPVIVLNDQGGAIMNVSDKPSTLRAQMKHHEPIVCFEPGVAKREGGQADS